MKNNPPNPPPMRNQKGIPWWQLPAEAFLRNPVVRKLYGLEPKKPTTLGEIKKEELK